MPGEQAGAGAGRGATTPPGGGSTATLVAAGGEREWLPHGQALQPALRCPQVCRHACAEGQHQPLHFGALRGGKGRGEAEGVGGRQELGGGAMPICNH